MRFFESYSTPAVAMESMRIQLWGTWEQARGRGLAYEPTPSGGFLETVGAVMLLAGADADARPVQERALQSVSSYLADPDLNKYARASLEQTQRRLEVALRAGLRGLESLNPSPVDTPAALLY